MKRVLLCILCLSVLGLCFKAKELTLDDRLQMDNFKTIAAIIDKENPNYVSFENTSKKNDTTIKVQTIEEVEKSTRYIIYIVLSCIIAAISFLLGCIIRKRGYFKF